MEIAKIYVSESCAQVIAKKPIPAGLVGGYLDVVYAEELWADLTKTVVFRSTVTRDVICNDRRVEIPAEVLAAGTRLWVGFYGTGAEKALPTFWANLGTVGEAADPSGDESTDPALPVWAQVLEKTAALEKKVENDYQPKGDYLESSQLQPAIETALTQAKENGEFDGAPGKSAYEYAKAGGYPGTEEEFAAKLAKEFPAQLPNPYALTINGSTYDGSAPVEMTIEGNGMGGADWNAIEGEAGYIANRPFGSVPVSFIPENTMALVLDEGVYYNEDALIAPYIPSVGDEYIITFNGIQHRCVATAGTGDLEASIWFGNKAILSQWGHPEADIPDTGENFLVSVSNDLNKELYVFTRDTSDVTFSIDSIGTKKLDITYAPEIPSVDLTFLKLVNDGVEVQTEVSVENAYEIANLCQYDQVAVTVKVKAGATNIYDNVRLVGSFVSPYSSAYKFDCLYNGCTVSIILSGTTLTGVMKKLGGATPDWNAAEGQAGHVLNRTHWTDTYTVDDPTFDGDLTGREVLQVDATSYAVKVSPQYVRLDEIVDADVTLFSDGAEVTVPITPSFVVSSAEQIWGIPGTVVLMGEDPILLSVDNDYDVQGATLTAGTWFMCVPDTFYVKSLSVLASGEVEVVHQINPKYIPIIGNNPFKISEFSGEKGYFEVGKGTLFYSTAIQQQINAGLAPLRFDFKPLGAETASEVQVLFVGTPSLLCGNFTHGNILYLAEVAYTKASDVMMSLTISPVRCRRKQGGTNVYDDALNCPILWGNGGVYHYLTVDSTGAVTAKELNFY